MVIADGPVLLDIWGSDQIVARYIRPLAQAIVLARDAVQAGHFVTIARTPIANGVVEYDTRKAPAK